MDRIEENLKVIKMEICKTAVKCKRNPEDITLVAVSKKKSIETIIKAVDGGIDILGENYIQEAIEKIESINKIVDKKIIWHFIGHLQSNKAKFAVKYFDLIHTVDSLKTAEEIDRQAEKICKIQNILIQINISEEKTKSGAETEDVIKLIKDISKLNSLSIKGLMGMPPFFNDPEKARPYFKKLAKLRDLIKDKNIPKVYMEHISMGMSGDFKIAIEEGATIVRIGTSIFGNR